METHTNNISDQNLARIETALRESLLENETLREEIEDLKTAVADLMSDKS